MNTPSHPTKLSPHTHGTRVTVPAHHQRLLQLAGIAAVAVAIALVIIKLAAWLSSGSVSVLASLIDSSLDGLVSLLNCFAIRYAMAPADDEHRFGHGKAEAVAGLIQVAFICGSAGFLFLHAINNLLDPQALTHTDTSVAAMAVSLLLTLALVTFQQWVVKRTGSNAVAADSLHYLSDILANGSVIVALLLSYWGYTRVDAGLGIIISFFILHTAWQIGKRSLKLLLDEELGPAVWQPIEQIVLANPDVRGYHQLRTRQSGNVMFVQLHIELDKHMPLLQAHAITEEIEEAIRARYPNADVLIHTDPV